LDPENSVAREGLRDWEKQGPIEVFEIKEAGPESQKVLGVRISNLDRVVAEDVTITITFPSGAECQWCEVPFEYHAIKSKVRVLPIKRLEPDDDVMCRIGVHRKDGCGGGGPITVKVESPTFDRPISLAVDNVLWDARD
jgi:hypothetical protein